MVCFIKGSEKTEKRKINASDEVMEMRERENNNRGRELNEWYDV